MEVVELQGSGGRPQMSACWSCRSRAGLCSRAPSAELPRLARCVRLLVTAWRKSAGGWTEGMGVLRPQLQSFEALCRRLHRSVSAAEGGRR